MMNPPGDSPGDRLLVVALSLGLLGGGRLLPVGELSTGHAEEVDRAVKLHQPDGEVSVVAGDLGQVLGAGGGEMFVVRERAGGA